jgi:hypothetical protein
VFLNGSPVVLRDYLLVLQSDIPGKQENARLRILRLMAALFVGLSFEVALNDDTIAEQLKVDCSGCVHRLECLADFRASDGASAQDEFLRDQKFKSSNSYQKCDDSQTY